MKCGSMGCSPIKKLVSEFETALPENVVLTVICGTNQSPYRALKKKYDNDRIRICGFVQNISLLMDSVDLFLTKPGGISVTETYFKELPMVFVNAVAGCEDHNLHYFIDRGMAQSADSIKGISEICISLLRDDKRGMKWQGKCIKFIKQTQPSKYMERFSHCIMKKNAVSLHMNDAPVPSPSGPLFRDIHILAAASFALLTSSII